ncbi:MAG: hydrogenase maturation protease [archaeon]|nr:MAG: hydrogenase maturation protease [archaeon]
MILIIGVGNDMRGDDAFGPLVIQELRRTGTQATLWSGGAPENFIGKIREPVETLVILDTAYLGKEPGTVEIIDPDKIKGHVSTHKLPLSLLIKTLRPEKTYFIAAQPLSSSFGVEPSPEILRAVERAKEIVLDLPV